MLRSIRLAAAALSVAAVAACSDSPTAPAAAEAPNAAIVAQPGRTQYFVTYAVTGQDGAPLVMTSAMFETSAGYQKEIFDNKEGDLDARWGFYKVSMPIATSYKAGLRQVGSPYGAYGSIREKARTGTLTDLGTVMANKLPVLRAMFRDQATSFYIGTAKIIVRGPNDYGNVVTDNFNYVDKADILGMISVILPTSGTYEVCEIGVPSGYFAPNPSCKQFQAKWNEYSDVTFLHQRLVRAQ